MSVKSDRWIRRMAEQEGMIDPFEPGQVNFWERYLEWKETNPEESIPNRGLVGSPETIRKRLQDFQDAHIDQVILLNQAGKNTHEDICDSLELFAKEVMPDFHGQDKAHQEWKAAVLAGELELEEIDTEAYNAYSLQSPVKDVKAAGAKAQVN